MSAQDLPPELRRMLGLDQPERPTAPVIALPLERGAADRYGRAALTAECDRVATAPQGSRNDTLNRAAFSLAQLVTQGVLDEAVVRDNLTAAALAAGLTEREVDATLASAGRGAVAKPRPPVQLVDDTSPDPFILHTPTADEASEDQGEADDTPAGDGMDDVRARFRDGGTFILDIPDEIPAVWGDGDAVLWASGEALTICGPAGVGKTTLTGQVVRGRLVGGTVLGLTVRPTSSRVLYLAMDRPRQIARSLRRTLGNLDRDVLAERLIVWPGPPIADVAAHPETLLALVQIAGADTVVIDSIKDAAVGLSSDEVGAGYNRARQMCIAAGIEVIEQHHMVKKGDNGAAPTSLADLYGSVWIGAGSGSVVLLHGSAGDPIVAMRHLKTPADEVGPYQLVHDHDAGVTTIHHSADLVELARCTPAGVTARMAAQAIEDTDKPSKAAVEKARRRLDDLAGSGLLVRSDGAKGGVGGGAAATWFYVSPATITATDHGDHTDHETDHARDRSRTDHADHDRSRDGSETPRNGGKSDHASDHADHTATDHVPSPLSRGGGTCRGSSDDRWVPIAGGTKETNPRTGEVRDR